MEKEIVRCDCGSDRIKWDPGDERSGIRRGKCLDCWEEVVVTQRMEEAKAKEKK